MTVQSTVMPVVSGEKGLVASAPARWLPWAAWVIAVFAGGCLAVLVSQWGLGVSPDSVRYWRAALGVADGHAIIPSEAGLNPGSAHYPPLYPMVLSTAAQVCGADLPEAARWLHAALLAGNLLLIAKLTSRATGMSGSGSGGGGGGVALAAVAVAACNSAFLEAHVWILSEPLFLLCALAALLLLGRGLALPPQRRRRLLFWAALATAAASLTRYAGLAMLAAGVLAIVTSASGPRRQRIVDAAVFALLAGFPLGAWLLRNHFLLDATVNRSVSWIGLGKQHVQQLREALMSWLVPSVDGQPVLLAIIVLAFVGGCLIEARRRRANPPSTPTPGGARLDDPGASAVQRMLAIFAVCYVLLVVVTVTLLDASTPLDARIQLPLQAVLIVWITARLGRYVIRAPRARPLAGVFLVLLIGINVYGAIDWGNSVWGRGRGFTARRWATSPTLAQASLLPVWTMFYTNAPEVLWVHLQRPAAMLPRAGPEHDRASGMSYAQRLANLAQTLRTTDSAVVWFHRAPRTATFEPEAKLVRKLGLVEMFRTKEGALYRAAGSTTRPTPLAAPGLPDTDR